MKNVKIRFRNITATAFTLMVLICLSQTAIGQATIEDNTPAFGAFLGWDDNSNTTLRVRQNDRVRIWLRDTTYNHVNDGTLQNVTRMAIHENTSTTGIPFPYASFQPASMLHIGKAIPQPLVRSWMNIGTTYGNRHDGMYVGLYDVPDDVYDPTSTRKADAVIAWGCNSIGNMFGPDNMRFIFLAPTNGVDGTGPEMDDEGREVARFSPPGNFGIGNFYTNGLDEHPTQKLDVDGTARLRQMPNNTPEVVITGVEADDTGDYILNYSTLEDFVGEIDVPCDWDVIGNNVAMGFPTACVTDQMLVGADAQAGTNAKAYMTKDYSGTTLRAEALVGDNAEIAGYFEAGNVTDTQARGVFGEARNSRTNIGLEGWAHVASNSNYGFRGTAEDGRWNYGGYGSATDATNVNYGLYGIASGGDGEFVPINNVGVYGQARNYSSVLNFGGYFVACDGEKNIGLYAEGCGASGTAAHFAGGIVTLGGVLSLSDESIKNEIVDIESAIDKISQLQPKQYNFNTVDYPHLNLKNELSYGFSAQEMQVVLPELVGEIYHPAKYDTSGEEISPSENLLGIHYQELIAILTAGIKEQQAQIQSQDDQIAGLQEAMMQMQEQMQMMQDQINGCCQGDITPKNSGMGQDNSPSERAFGQNELYQNTPNPFRSQTTISYTLEQGGKVLLNIFDKTGKPIATLVEAEQPADTYRYEWDARGLPAGLYHYALYVDGELLVKKAIKLAD